MYADWWASGDVRRVGICRVRSIRRLGISVAENLSVFVGSVANFQIQSASSAQSADGFWVLVSLSAR